MLAARLRPPPLTRAAVLGLMVIGCYVVLVQWSAQAADYTLWGGLVVIPALLLLSIPLLVRAGRADPDPRFLQLLVAAFVLKAAATAVRYWTAFVFYDGVADANGYDGAGTRLAESYRNLDFSADLEKAFIGTGFIRALTGVLYAITGPSVYIGFAFFAWVGFWGLYFLYRAFSTGFPNGDHRRYAILVLFLPSMLFWPSSLGKEAWMTFGIGLAAFGAARFLTVRSGWLVPLAVGLTATAMVRPHVTAILFAGMACAVVLRPAVKPTTALTPLARGGLLVTVAAVGILLADQAASFLGVEDLSKEGVDSAVGSTGDRTSQGGSEFSPHPVRSPLDLPMAAATVVFRPFLFEAGNTQTLIAAAEGTLLLVLAVLAIPRLRGLLGRLRHEPYLVFCLAYSTMFVYAFSNFSNFGILTRQRVQVLPFVLVLLALPSIRDHTRRRLAQPPAQEART